MALLHLHSAPCLATRRHIVVKGNVDSFAWSVKPLRCCPAQLQTGRLAVAKRQSRVAWAAAAEAATADVAVRAFEENDSQPEGQDSAAERQDNRPIVVGDKPAANSLLRRLEQVPQTTIRAYTNKNDMHTYKTIATVATAQRVLNQPGKVLLYVPYTKGRFSAIVLTTSSRVLQSSSSGSIPRLQVKGATDPEALARTLSFDLIKHGTAVLESSGAAATSKAAAALMLVRQQMLKRGYELGVVPRFEEQKITVVSQQVVLQELPVPCVSLPRADWKPLDAAAAAARAMLAKQRRVQLVLPPVQLNRLSGMLAQVMQTYKAEQQQEQEQGKAAGSGKLRGKEDKKRLLLVWPPSTADQLLESLEQLNQFATASMADNDAAASSAAAVATGSTAQAVDEQQMIQLQLRRSRLVTIPSPEVAFTRGGPGAKEDRKPAVATADSSVSGLAGAIEARVTRTGASWLVTDGSKEAHAIAWQAFLHASSKMDAADGAGGLLALVDVQDIEQAVQQQHSSHTLQQAGADSQGSQQEKSADAQGTAEQQQQQQPWQAKVEQQAKAQQQRQQQQQQRKAKAAVQAAPQPNYKLKMLIVRDSDIARSILQSPNTPLEVSVSADLWPLLKFATSANTFLPISRSAGTGGLVMLPAVLPAPAEPAASSEAAVAADYRFDDQKQQLVPYAIRLQRFTGRLPEGLEVEDSQQLRVSLSTDPIKLRDAIVAKVLQQQPASVRFVGPLGRTPPLLTIAMAAVAAARVRLQQKGAGADVGIMPYAETLTRMSPTAAAAAATDGESAAAATAAAAGGKGKKQQGGRGANGVQAGRVVYSLRLVPMPAVGAVAAEAGSDSANK